MKFLKMVKRSLIFISIVALTIPFVFTKHVLETRKISVPILYWFGSYFILINTNVVQSINNKPIYFSEIIDTIEDIDKKKKIIKIYTFVMNILLSLIGSGVIEFFLFQDFYDKSLVEIAGIVGGNIGLYFSCQNTCSEILLKLINYFIMTKPSNSESGGAARICDPLKCEIELEIV